ncbi:MAG: complement resistance protein TraT [Deltaproteobacteria bacterium]|nr:complement resistance protein TraT [Kofleriaceae bacterium]
MGAALIGFVIGFALGLGTGSAAGALVVAILGALVGVSAHAARWLWAHRGDSPTVERHRVFCTPYGRSAVIDFVGDLETRRWLDVKRCSLLRVATDVSCDKRCVNRMRDSGIKPGDRCDCHA